MKTVKIQHPPERPALMHPSRREFLDMLVHSGLLLAGGSALGGVTNATAWEEAVIGEGVAPDYAFNPINPYLQDHNRLVPASSQSGGAFELVNWQSPYYPRVKKKPNYLLAGTLDVAVEHTGNRIEYIVRRDTTDDRLEGRWKCSADAWHTPQAWRIEQAPHPSLRNAPVYYSSPPRTPEADKRLDLNPSDANLVAVQEGRVENGRILMPPRIVSSALNDSGLPLTLMSALLGSRAVLEYAVRSGSAFLAVSENGTVLGPLQARSAGSVRLPNGTPYGVVAIWGRGLLPTHVILDSEGAVAQTGFLMSAVRKAI